MNTQEKIANEILKEAGIANRPFVNKAITQITVDLKKARESA